MNRYKIATKIDSLRNKIAKELFGEKEDCDGVRYIPSWEIFEKTLEQHKQISNLQSQINKLKKILESSFTEELKSIGIYPEDSDCIKELFQLL